MSFLDAIKKRSDLRSKGVKKQQSDKDPNSVTDQPWIYESDPKHLEVPSGGKWMHFYDRKVLWSKWKELQVLYRSGKLLGVNELKVSTKFHTNNSLNGVIIIYCGPTDDEDRVIMIGKLILAYSNYSPTNKMMYYKTDDATVRKSYMHKYSLKIEGNEKDNLNDYINYIKNWKPKKKTNKKKRKYKKKSFKLGDNKKKVKPAPIPKPIAPIPKKIESSENTVKTAPIPKPMAPLPKKIENNEKSKE